MILDQGVLKPRSAGKQVTPNYRQEKQGLSIQRMDRLLRSGKPDICVVRSLGGIGDVLMTTPFVRALKYKWPNSHLTYATDFKYIGGALRDILLYNPYIDELLQYQTVGSKEYDFKIDVTSVCVGVEKAGVPGVPNRIDLFANYVGISLDNSGYLPDYIVSTEEKKWAQEKLNRYPRRHFSPVRIGIQVRSSTVARSWPLDRVRELAIRLVNEQHAQVVVFDSSHGGGPQEQWNIPGIICIKDHKIREVGALIDQMDLMVTPDSGLMHIAGALNKKIISIWAGTDPDARINYYPNAVAIARQEYSCFPCWYDAEPCKKSYLCIKSITVDEVLEAVNKCLQAPAISMPLGVSVRNDIVYLRRDVGGYGDIVCMTGAVADLKKRDPEVKVRLALPKKYHCVFDNNPDVERCIDPDVTSITVGCKVYNLTAIDAISEVAELRKHKKVKTTRPQVYLKALGNGHDDNPETCLPRLYVTDEEKKWATKMFLKDQEKKYIFTALRSAEEYRNWPLEKYFEVFGMAEKEHPDWMFVLCGGDRFEGELPSNVIDATGFSFRKTITLTSMVDCVLTPDTSVLHVSAAFNKPCVALFGPIDSEIRCKYYEETTPVFHKLDCVPCWRNANIPCKHTKKTTNDQSYCMSKITSEEVFKALEEKLL